MNEDQNENLILQSKNLNLKNIKSKENEFGKKNMKILKVEKLRSEITEIEDLRKVNFVIWKKKSLVIGHWKYF